VENQEDNRFGRFAMRSLQVAATVLAALTLAACAGTPDRKGSEQDQIVSKIMGGGGNRMNTTNLQCPSNMVRHCSGPDSALVCGCMSSDSLRRIMGSNY
jgi:hypothetical protein